MRVRILLSVQIPYLCKMVIHTGKGGYELFKSALRKHMDKPQRRGSRKLMSLVPKKDPFLPEGLWNTLQKGYSPKYPLADFSLKNFAAAINEFMHPTPEEK